MKKLLLGILIFHAVLANGQAFEVMNTKEEFAKHNVAKIIALSDGRYSSFHIDTAFVIELDTLGRPLTEKGYTPDPCVRKREVLYNYEGNTATVYLKDTLKSCTYSKPKTSYSKTVHVMQNGKLHKTEEYGGSSRPRHFIEYRYNEAGNLSVKKYHFPPVQRRGSAPKKKIKEYKYSYDSKQRIIREIFSYSRHAGWLDGYTVTYSYDGNKAVRTSSFYDDEDFPQKRKRELYFNDNWKKIKEIHQTRDGENELDGNSIVTEYIYSDNGLLQTKQAYKIYGGEAVQDDIDYTYQIHYHYVKRGKKD
jgi:hypothetical protein